ncbi:MAG: glycine cleavage system protein H [Gemmataceae bacterium]|nr:glycine cleavage system protein H [Gemmataceae bacterium]MCS7270778.1 glycine cleavage system protein H [Gemmataceae bacterium]MDW8244408.1 glycine cleavage system protein H [Thermogemmata sp.]
MSSGRFFLMGKYQAPLPAELRYCRNHMWCRLGDQGVHTFGFTSYAVRLMRDVYFLEWRIDAGQRVTARQEIGFIETQKATSGLYAPLTGELIAFNHEVLQDPGLINVDCYGTGWLFQLRGDATETLSVDEYYKHLEAGWENTQRLIKAQINKLGLEE